MKEIIIGTGKNSVGIGDVMITLACADAANRRKRSGDREWKDVPIRFETTRKVADWVGNPLSGFTHLFAPGEHTRGDFQGSVELVVSSDPYETPNAAGPGTFRERKLRHYGLPEGAIALIHSKAGRGESVVVCTHCSRQWQDLRGGHNADWSCLRRRFSCAPILNLDNLCGVVGVSAWDGSRHVEAGPCSIPEIISTMSGCTQYVGVDTGWLHVAVSLGMDCVCLVPNDCPEYRHADWHYTRDLVSYLPL